MGLQVVEAHPLFPYFLEKRLAILHLLFSFTSKLFFCYNYNDCMWRKIGSNFVISPSASASCCQGSDNTEASMKKQIRRIHSVFSHVGP